ncbi:hypothetical protein A3850_003050 [Lewinella sp. 4G2]|nr:hypothetical protein A3850_003050 [Lewinella sp. 4G2]
MVSMAIFLTFLIGRSLFDEGSGFYAALLFSIHGLSNELSIGVEATDHIDVHFMFWIAVAAYLVTASKMRSRYLKCALIGVTIGLAVLVKWLPAYTILLAYIAFELRNGKFLNVLLETAIIAVCSVIVWLPWQIYAYTSFPEVYLATQAHNFQHITQYLEGHENGYLFFLDKSIYNYGEIWILSIGLLIYYATKSNPERYRFLLLWIIVPLIFFSFVATKMQGYVYFTAPAIFIASGVALKAIYDWKKWHRLPIGKLLFILGFVSPIVHFYESLHPREHDENLVARLQTLKNSDLDRTVIFNSPTPYNDMFFLNVVASYDYVPDQRTLDSLRSVYTVIVEEE